MTILEPLRIATHEEIKDIYINEPKITYIGLPNPAAASDGVATAVYTVGEEDYIWYVCDSIDEVMKKIKKA